MRKSKGAPLGAIEAVYRRDRDRFLHVAVAILGDRDRAADAVQEAFASAVRHRGGFRSEGPLEGWLWRTLVNAARQSARREPATALEDSCAVPERMGRNGSTPHEDEASVRTLVAALPERQRLILFLRYYADLDYQAIADALDVSVGTVGSTLSAAHSALRGLIKEVQT